MGRHLSSVEKWINEVQLTRREMNEAKLTLATLCDMVLGEDAKDRSDDALIRAIGNLIRKDGGK